jgi:EmrB/QacA subfamily drug resistance transporter
MPETSAAPGSASAETPGTTRRWMVLALVSLGFLMVELDITIVNVALPSIQEDLGFSGSDLQWVVNAYLLLFGGFVLLAGRGADLFGRKRMFMGGIAVFGLGSAVSALAPSAAPLIVGRALQGLGGAALAPTGLSLLTTTFTDTGERTRVLAVWTFILTGSVAIGLTLGGVITDALSWRWIFVINLPVVALLLVTAPRLLPRSPETAGQVDLAGATLSTAGPALLVYGLANVPDWGWESGRTVGFLTVGVAMLAALGVVERRVRYPLIRLEIFRIRPVTVGDLSFFLTSSAMFGAYFFGTLYVQRVLGYEPLLAGLALLPLAGGIMGGVSAAEPLTRRLDIRAAACAGLGIGVIGTALLTRLSAETSYAWPFLPGLFLLSLGIGLTIVTLTFLAASGVPQEDAGLASGLYTAFSYGGGALGLAILSTIAASRTADVLAATPGAEQAALVDGYRAAYMTVALLLGAAAVLILTLLRRRHVAALQTSPAKDEP